MSTPRIPLSRASPCGPDSGTRRVQPRLVAEAQRVIPVVAEGRYPVVAAPLVQSDGLGLARADPEAHPRCALCGGDLFEVSRELLGEPKAARFVADVHSPQFAVTTARSLRVPEEPHPSAGSGLADVVIRHDELCLLRCRLLDAEPVLAIPGYRGVRQGSNSAMIREAAFVLGRSRRMPVPRNSLLGKSVAHRLRKKRSAPVGGGQSVLKCLAAGGPARRGGRRPAG